MKTYRNAVRVKGSGLAALALVASALVLFPAASSAQAKKPISLDGLVKAVRINGL
jgi:hypothetical protein